MIEQINDILEGTRIYISDVRPSQWFESRMIMPPGSAFPGKFSYDLTPYAREIVDCADPNDPSKKIAIIKGGQIGLSAGVLRPVIAYTIAENPGNILFLIGNDNLVDPGMVALDHVIDNCDIRKLIGSSIERAKNSRTGDTNRTKEFYGGSLLGGSGNNHSIIAQLDIMVMIVDDFDLIKNKSGTDGDTRKLFEQRTAAYEHKMKIYYVSTPRVLATSNIYPAFKMGDQRYFNVPCPHCKDPISYTWNTHVHGNKSKVAGMFWRLDKNGELDPSSVSYICQLCGKPFDDSDKYERNKKGIWIPTATPKEPGFKSFSISSLYAPPGMKRWIAYIRDYIEANPLEGKRHEAKHQSFLNLCLGQCYEPEGSNLKATQLMKNLRPYTVGEVPEDLSIKDGNGEIVMLTCAIDLNGVYGRENRTDDVRLDYEVLAWSASGSTYSIEHGSIGTFIFHETDEEKKIPREKWTYNHEKPNNVWRKLNEILSKNWPVSGSTRTMKILITAMDTGYAEKEAFEYIDQNRFFIVGVKGNPENKLKPLDRETKNFKIGASRKNLYILDGHTIKDNLAGLMRMTWNQRSGESQPTGFMNYPSLGLQQIQNDKEVVLYQFENFFSHYEAELKVEEKDKNDNVKGFVWRKRNSTVQNHCFDLRYYNHAAMEIIMDQYFKELKIKHYSWTDFVRLILHN